MNTDRAPYSRVYWSVMDDPKFDGIRDDLRLFGSWSLLLLVADMAWPAPAFVPPTVPKAALAKLVAAGLVDELGGHRIRMHGLDAERDKRSQTGRNAAAQRWQSERITKPMLDETRQAETRQAEQNARANGQKPKRVFAPPRAPNTSPLQKEIRAAIVERYGEGDSA